MPDWSYQPFLRPLLFQLPSEQARKFTVESIARLARLPGGPLLIDLLGHMQPSTHSGGQVFGLDFRSFVGLGASIDPSGKALDAFERFGFGFIELGPVRSCENAVPRTCERDTNSNSLRTNNQPSVCNLADIVANLTRFRSRKSRRGIHIAVRIAIGLSHNPMDLAADVADSIHQLENLADWIVLDTAFASSIKDEAGYDLFFTQLAMNLGSNLKCVPLALCIDPSRAISDSCLMIEQAQSALGIDTVVISGGVLLDTEGKERLFGSPTRDHCINYVKELRSKFGDDIHIIASGGIIEPADALDYFDSGACLIQLHSGLVFSGPGLPKRINEALAGRLETDSSPQDHSSAVSILGQGWFYGFLLGCGMVIGGILAWVLGMTRVLLPYDERFLGMSLAQIQQINPNLLCFMMHDRVTLAGTMMSIGIVYIGLSVFGIRRGEHWAWKALTVSAAVGFVSFFLYLGYGYFDPLHAAVSSLLLPIFLACAFLGPSKHRPVAPTSLRNDRYWQRGMRGQLLMVVVAVGLVLAGLTIACVGMTHIFVPTDLQFLMTTPNALRAANPHLLPMIAHDRAGFGGALASSGLAVLLTVLWGYKSGAKWVWWTLALAALPGYFGVFLIHMMIGYMNPIHVGPAFVAAGFTALGLGLSYGFLCAKQYKTNR